MLTVISSQQNFNGQLFIQGKLTPQLRNKFSPYQKTIEDLLKDKKFDIYVRQSSSGSLLFSTNKAISNWVGVAKKDKNYVEVVTKIIEDWEKGIKEAVNKVITTEDNIRVKSLLYLDENWKYKTIK